MGMLTWPADQSCGRHCALQLGGGGKGVGDASHPHWWDTVGQVTLWALREVGRHEKAVWAAVGFDSAGVLLKRTKCFLTCLMEWWWMRFPRLAWWWCCREDTLAWTCFSCWATRCSAFIDEEADEEDDEVLWETCEDACWIIRCSISCSCCSALTNAAFSLLVCSAFRAFFWLDDMQSSHSTVPPLVLSCLQRQVKSVLHWLQMKGSLTVGLGNATPVFPGWKQRGNPEAMSKNRAVWEAFVLPKKRIKELSQLLQQETDCHSWFLQPL